MHNIVPGPRALVDASAAACRDRGVRFMTGCAASDLVMGSDGAVVAVTATSGGQKVRIGAKAVVLCSGDYLANRDLMRRFAPGATLAEPILATHTGDAHAMAMSVGAVARGLERVTAPQIRTTTWPHVEPAPGLYELGAALLDRRGQSRSPDFEGVVARSASELVRGHRRILRLLLHRFATVRRRRGRRRKRSCPPRP